MGMLIEFLENRKSIVHISDCIITPWKTNDLLNPSHWANPADYCRLESNDILGTAECR